MKKVLGHSGGKGPEAFGSRKAYEVAFYTSVHKIDRRRTAVCTSSGIAARGEMNEKLKFVAIESRMRCHLNSAATLKL